MVDTNQFEVVDDGCLCGFLEHVEVDVCTKASETSFRIDDIGSHHSSKSFSFWFPGKRNDGIFNFDDLNRDILLPNMENLKVRKRRLLGFRMSVNLDAQEL